MSNVGKDPVLCLDSSPSLLAQSIPQIDGNVDSCDDERLPTASSVPIDEKDSKVSNSPSHLPTGKVRRTSSSDLIERYQQWSTSKFGRAMFTITSDDGYQIASDDLDHAWSGIVGLVRTCRDDMQLTHLPMSNDELNGHQIFGLTTPIVKIMLNQIYQRSSSNQEQNSPVTLPLSSSSKNKHPNGLLKRKMNRSKTSTLSSRVVNYQRKSSQRQRFNWLCNPNRKLEYALNSFAIDDALTYAR